MSVLANSPTVAVFHALGKTQLYTRLIARRSITLSPSSSYESTKLSAYQTRIYKGDGQTVSILVPAKPHGPENSVAGDLATTRSGSCNRKIEKIGK